MEQIVAAVTRQVLAALGSRQEENMSCEGKLRCLVVGEMSDVPEKLRVGAVLEGMEAYESCANILRYQKVIITRLELVQLADIAQGRPADAVSCAVVQALLNGVEVILLETAPVHRRYAGKSSTGLYGLLEGYVRTIQGFGVKLLTQDRMVEKAAPPAKPPKFQAPAPTPVQGSAKPNPQCLITESAALAMAAVADGTVRLERGTILTPSARDVFVRAGLTIERVDG